MPSKAVKIDQLAFSEVFHEVLQKPNSSLKIRFSFEEKEYFNPLKLKILAAMVKEVGLSLQEASWTEQRRLIEVGYPHLKIYFNL